MLSRRRSFALQAEQIWEKFHALRISTEFRGKWDEIFCKATDKRAPASVFQYITTRWFRELIKENFEVKEENKTSCPTKLTSHEENALRYVAGYVCRKVHSKLEKSSHDSKEDMTLLMIEFYGSDLQEEDSEEWTNQIDRGGLWHINNNVYLVFTIIEQIIRNYLHVESIGELGGNTRSTILDSILTNDDLLTLWGMLTAHYGEEVPTAVLKKISELYLTVRGFSFASSCLELYKQRYKSQLQKSKGLRRKLQTTQPTTIDE